MPTFPIIVFCFLCCCLRAFAQVDFKADTLVDCGSDEAVVFGGTGSPDGNFALGWTIRPQQNKAPVDWSAYEQGNPLAILDRYPIVRGFNTGDYLLINGLIDLHAKRFIAFTSKDPCLPHKHRAAFHVAWSDAQRGVIYALVYNDVRFHTENLWLVAIGKQGVHITDLVAAAEKPVRGFLHEHTPKKFDDYGISYGPDSSTGNQAAPKLFGKSTVKISFEAEDPKLMDDAGYAGSITVMLLDGKVTGVTGKKLSW